MPQAFGRAAPVLALAVPQTHFEAVQPTDQALQLSYLRLGLVAQPAKEVAQGQSKGPPEQLVGSESRMTGQLAKELAAGQSGRQSEPLEAGPKLVVG